MFILKTQKSNKKNHKILPKFNQFKVFLTLFLSRGKNKEKRD